MDPPLTYLEYCWNDYRIHPWLTVQYCWNDYAIHQVQLTLNIVEIIMDPPLTYLENSEVPEGKWGNIEN